MGLRRVQLDAIAAQRELSALERQARFTAEGVGLIRGGPGGPGGRGRFLVQSEGGVRISGRQGGGSGSAELLAAVGQVQASLDTIGARLAGDGGALLFLIGGL